MKTGREKENGTQEIRMKTGRKKDKRKKMGNQR